MNFSKDELFICNCSSEDHQLIFRIWDFSKDENVDVELSVSVCLNDNCSFLMRIWNSIKYIFGHRCNYGHFQSADIKLEDLPRLRAVLDEFERKRLRV